MGSTSANTCRDVSSEHAALLRAELDVLFTFGLDEDQVFALVRNYGCDWSARARGLTTTDWLRSVRERLD
jgi:CdiI immunity protein